MKSNSTKEKTKLTDAYVVKPVNFQDFIATVKQIGSFWVVINELPPERD